MSEAHYVRTNRPKGCRHFPVSNPNLIICHFSNLAPLFVYFSCSRLVPCNSKPDRDESNHRPKGPTFFAGIHFGLGPQPAAEQELIRKGSQVAIGVDPQRPDDVTLTVTGGDPHPGHRPPPTGP